MRSALYGRVSSEEQIEGYSIDAQQRAFHTLNKDKNWNVFKEYKRTEMQIRQLSPAVSSKDSLKRLANFLANVAEAWRDANQNQRNNLARVLFEEIRLDNGGRVVSVKPRTEFESFFKLSFECQAKDIAGDPGGIRTPDLHRDRVAC
jgi:hypothetical protein